jgi:predicted deacylase
MACDAVTVVTRRVITSANPTLDGLQWPVFEATGAHDGPRLLLMAGIHGCEYPAIAGVRGFMRGLDTAELSGSIRAVPIASPTTFTGRSAFVVPEDGKNLNRCFPGDPNGSFTEALADHIFTEFISPADLVIDLHGGDLFEALEPFAIYDDSPQRETAHRMATAFGLPYVISQEGGDLGGMTSSAAAAAGKPAIIAEVGGCGLLEQDAVDRHVAGVQNALRAVGMLSGEPQRLIEKQWLAREFRWLHCADAGWWQAEVTVGQRVAAGDRLGAVLDPFGDELEVIDAPLDGAIGFITSSPAVADGGLLLAIAGGLSPIDA